MPLAPGSRLGPYEISAPLGAGGMGEVYRARDSRLKRNVAIKVLRSSGSGTQASALLRRLEQEARTIAALNHPNLVAIYDVGELEGAPFLVMELLEGETLRARLRQGPLPLRRALDCARQLAQGLAAAHASGIIHRDLKPENIILAPDGRLKILDFGLAKSNELLAASADAETLVETSPALITAAGAVMGTVGYMAPEQVRGEPAGAAADIFAFGAIVYEMLVGRRAFQAPTSAEIMTAILREDPPDLTPTGAAAVPPALDRIIRRCLEKNPSQRFHSAADLDFALGALGDASSSSLHAVPAAAIIRRPRHWRTPAAVALAALAGAAICALFTLDRVAPIISFADLRPLSLHGPALNATPLWSPDGSALAYSAETDSNNPRQAFLYRLGASTSLQLTHAPADVEPIGWSRDGQNVIFVQDQFAAPTIWSVSAVGGQPRMLESLGHPTGGAQGVAADDNAVAAIMPQPDGKLGIAYSSPVGAPLKWYRPAPFALTALTDFPSLAFSPDGDTLLLSLPDAAGPVRTWILPFPPAAPRSVLNGLPPHDAIRMAWMPDGRRVLISAMMVAGTSSLWSADPNSGRMQILASGLPGAYLASLSPRRNALAVVTTFLDLDVVSADTRTAAVTPLFASVHKESMPAWASQASSLVYVTDRDGQDEVWMYEATPSATINHVAVTPAQMGEPGAFQLPALSPHAHRIAVGFTRTATGTQPQPARLWLVSAAGGAPVPLTAPSDDFQSAAAWSPDGSQIAYFSTAGPVGRLMVVAATGSATPRVVKREVFPFAESGPAWSPDGHWLAFQASDGLVHVISPDGASEHIAAHVPLSAFTFTADSRALYGIIVHGKTADLVTVPLATGTPSVIGSLGDHLPNAWFIPGIHLTLAPDGKSLAYNTGRAENDMDLVQPFSPPSGLATRIRFWLHLP